MGIAVTIRRRRRGVRSASIRADAARLLNELNVDAELSVVLVGDSEMQALNASYRKKNRPADVLAFSMREGESGLRSQPKAESRKRKAGDRDFHIDLLGDVVISVDTAARQAAERGVSVATEVRTLLTHGILHLLGYDHERSPADARRMFALQRKLLRLLDREARR
jgi:probable rRNA maturation factor